MIRCPHCAQAIALVAVAPAVEQDKPGRIRDPETLIVEAAAAHFGVRVPEMLQHDRHKNTALARHVAMHAMRGLLGRSYPEIGRAFGMADHTTAMHAVKRISAGLVVRDARVVVACEAVRSAYLAVYGSAANSASRETEVA